MALHLDGRSGSLNDSSSFTHSKPGLHFPQSPERVLQAPHVSPSSLSSTFQLDENDRINNEMVKLMK